MEQMWIEQLAKAVGEENLLVNEPMSRHTTFRIGGLADVLITPCDETALADAIRICREHGTAYTLIGNGSNLLVSDQGYRGVVMEIGRNMSRIEVEGRCMKAQAGALLISLARQAKEHALTGLEFASGIPGTLGGGVIMNAGAYGGEMKDVIRSVRVMNNDLEIFEVSGEEMDFGYRTSRAQKEGWIILGAGLELAQGDEEAITARMNELKQQRVTKQPLDFPSAGSTFKRPEGYFAGKLIMDAGLKGYRVGDAMVSEKHAGFVVNAGQATAAQVHQLMTDVTRIVEEKYGVTLEPEVKRLGDFV
ncbi:MAG: UDP-N-acetylmuramate dehydrogenase [Lachnospiraceae bacterium]|nr:UDP-N-acetylmuramate dehydrogenase [Lachnospiraceae bacterium]